MFRVMHAIEPIDVALPNDHKSEDAEPKKAEQISSDNKIDLKDKEKEENSK